MPTRQFFSEFTIAEQQLGLQLAAQHASYNKRKPEITGAIDAAKLRLAARPFFNEVPTLPELSVGFIADLKTAHQRYFQLQQTTLDEAQTKLAEMEIEWRALSTQLSANADLLQSIWIYQKKYRADPVVHEDMPAPDHLNEGIYAFESTLTTELEQTRTLLAERQPDLLTLHAFRLAEKYIGFGGAGMEIGAAADELRAARDILAKLRAQVS